MRWLWWHFGSLAVCWCWCCCSRSFRQCLLLNMNTQSVNLEQRQTIPPRMHFGDPWSKQVDMVIQIIMLLLLKFRFKEIQKDSTFHVIPHILFTLSRSANSSFAHTSNTSNLSYSNKIENERVKFHTSHLRVTFISKAYFIEKRNLKMANQRKRKKNHRGGYRKKLNNSNSNDLRF